MPNIYIKNYESILNISDTELAIKLVKDTFESKLAHNLGLVRVSAPLFVEPSTGLNDELSGKEKAVSFKTSNQTLEIVQSLAKWKRNALKKYSFKGLYTDMNAIRPNEELDNLHSLYVDQWDWEKQISDKDRNIDYLKETVDNIYKSLLETYKVLVKEYPSLKMDLPKDVKFITSEELLKKYPNLSPKEREYQITKEYKAVFVIGIGNKLSNGEVHDTRAADYDDWDLNGDLLMYYDVLDVAFELSSMGIRVNKESLLRQLKEKDEENKLNYQYHKDIVDDKLPLSIGGGVGQSRLCMFLLRKAHIGEVQSSYWSDKDIEDFANLNIKLL